MTSNLFYILFAVLESGFWGPQEIRIWSDQWIENLAKPQPWLMELSLCSSLVECKNVVLQAMVDAGDILPTDIGDLVVGFILLAFEAGTVSQTVATKEFFEIVDSYGSIHFDAEALTEVNLATLLENTNLKLPASQALEFLSNEPLLQTILLDDDILVP